jgi:hypothetical protein
MMRQYLLRGDALHLLVDDAVFPHPGAKNAGAESQEYRGPFFPLDSPTGFLGRLEDVVVFQVDESFDACTTDSSVLRNVSKRSNICSAQLWLVMTARSMTLSGFRTLPGQWYS